MLNLDNLLIVTQMTLLSAAPESFCLFQCVILGVPSLEIVEI